MPHFMSPADYCHGEGLVGGGVTAINKIPVLGPTTTATRALNEDEAICQLNGSQLWAVDKHGRSRLIDTQGANYLYARGNRWGAQLDIDGVATFRTGVNGSITPVELPIIGVGWGGQLMTKANPGAGLIVGGIHLSNGVVEDQQASADGKVIWREGFTVRTHGMTAPRRMPSEFYWMAHATVLGEEWIAYQHGWRVVARKFDDETSGYILPTSGVYGLEIIADGELLRFVWGVRSGEQPGDIEEHVISVHQPRVSLLPVDGGGDSIDVDPIDPDKPEEPTKMTPGQEIKPIIDAVQADPQYAVRLMENTEATTKRSLAYLSRVVVLAKKAGYTGWGLLFKPGRGLVPDVLTKKLENGRIWHYDAISGGDGINKDGTHTYQPHVQFGEIGEIEAGWSQWFPDGEGHEDPDPGDLDDAKKTHPYTRDDNDRYECNFILPNGKQCDQPRAAAIHQGKIDPPNDPPKPSTSVGLVVEVQKLIAAAVAPLSAKIAALEARPTGGGSFPSRIALKTAHGKYLSAQEDGSIVADRERVEPWERFTIEKQE